MEANCMNDVLEWHVNCKCAHLMCCIHVCEQFFVYKSCVCDCFVWRIKRITKKLESEQIGWIPSTTISCSALILCDCDRHRRHMWKCAYNVMRPAHRHTIPKSCENANVFIHLLMSLMTLVPGISFCFFEHHCHSAAAPFGPHFPILRFVVFYLGQIYARVFLTEWERETFGRKN